MEPKISIISRKIREEAKEKILDSSESNRRKKIKKAVENSQIKGNTSESNFKIANESFDEEIENLRRLGINIAKFETNLGKLKGRLFRFLDKYKVSFESLVANSSENLLLVLCLLDTWEIVLKNSRMENPEKITHLTELKKIVERFRLICITEEPKTEDSETNFYQQTDEKAAKRHMQKTVSTNREENYTTQRILVGEQIVDQHIDQEATAIANEQLFERVPELKELLGQHGFEEGKIPFSVKILNLSNEQLRNFPVGSSSNLGWSAFCTIDKSGEALICLPVDSSEKSFRQDIYHEALHILSWRKGGFVHGHMGIMGRGMDEAATEKQNILPLKYAMQRYVLQQLVAKSSSLDSLINEAYFGNRPKIDLLREIFRNWGSLGIIHFTFMASLPRELEGYGKKVLEDPVESLNFFAGEKAKNYIKVRNQTAKLREDLNKLLKAKFELALKRLNELKTEEEKNQYRKNSKKFTSLLKLLKLICNDLNKIDCWLERLPLEFLLEEDELLKYEKMLNGLENFEFVENEEAQINLAQMQTQVQIWTEKIEAKKEVYW